MLVSHQKKVAIIFAVSFFAFLSFFFYERVSVLVVGIVYDIFLKPPERTFCLDAFDSYRCITDRAIQNKDADICYYLDAGNSDRCIDDAIVGAKDVIICNKIKNRQTKKYCFDQYK